MDIPRVSVNGNATYTLLQRNLELHSVRTSFLLKGQNEVRVVSAISDERLKGILENCSIPRSDKTRPRVVEFKYKTYLIFHDEEGCPTASVLLTEAVFTDERWEKKTKCNTITLKRSGIIYGRDIHRPEVGTLLFSVEDVITKSWKDKESGKICFTISLTGTPDSCNIPIEVTGHRGIFPKSAEGDELFVGKGSWTMHMEHKQEEHTKHVWKCQATFKYYTHSLNPSEQNNAFTFHTRPMIEHQLVRANLGVQLVEYNPYLPHMPSWHNTTWQESTERSALGEIMQCDSTVCHPSQRQGREDMHGQNHQCSTGMSSLSAADTYEES